jgi:serine/threonine-protein kinase
MLAEAHIALGRVKQLFEWDWAGGEAEYRRGIELNPRAAYSLGIYHNFLMSVGRFEEAETISRKALVLDPVSPDAHFNLAWALDHMRRDDEALEAYERGHHLAPTEPNFFLELAQFHGERGRPNEASKYAEQAERVLGTGGPPAWMGRLGYDYAIINRPEDARRILGQLLSLAEQRYVPPTCPAVIYAGLGEKEKALDLLEEAYAKRDVIMVWMKVRHQFDPLRAEPRFQALLRRMKFPD